jgi:hypothetical protein
LYVAKTGSDANTPCLRQSAPCLTLNGAAKAANQLNALSGSVIISIGAGTWNENVSQNGPIPGCGNNLPAPLSLVELGPCMLLFKGSGAGSTVWNGAPAFFYTLQASNFGVAGIQDLTIKSTGGPIQLSMGSELGGQVYSYGGIEWGPSSYVQVWAQDAGSIAMLMGNDTITGSANSFASASGGANIQIVGNPLNWTAAISPGLSFPQGFVNLGIGGQYIDSNTTTHGFGNSITGPALKVSGNGLFVNQTGLPLSQVLPAGTQISQQLSGGRVVPAQGMSVEAGLPTGCGTTCTATISSGGPRSGVVTMTPGGTGIAAQGGFNLSRPVMLMTDAGAGAPCIATPNASGTGPWSSGSVAQTGDSSVLSAPLRQAFTVVWSNNGGVLTAGQTYKLNVICSEG